MFLLSARKKGFTLIELIIVIAIIAIIVSAVFVAIDPVKRLNDARDATAKQDAKNIGKAIELYLADGNSIPSTAFSPSTTAPTGLYSICPSNGAPNAPCGTNTLDPDFLIPGYLPAVNHAPSIPETSATTGYQVSYTNGALNGVSAPIISGSSSSSSAPPTIARPTQNVVIPWVTPNDYTVLIQSGDNVVAPTVPTALTVTTDAIHATSSDDGERQAYLFGAVPASSQIKVWVYGSCFTATTDPDQLSIDVSVNGGPANVGILPLPGSFGWYSVTIPGSLAAGNLTVGFTAPATINTGTFGSGCFGYTTYAEVTSS